MNDDILATEGWNKIPAKKFTAALGSTWMRGESPDVTVGWLSSLACENEYGGIIHGGAMMTFADVALGCGVGMHVGLGVNFVTVQLQYQFVAAGKAGSFISCAPEIVRRTSQLVFVRGLIVSEGRTLGSADGIFKLIDDSELARMRASRGAA